MSTALQQQVFALDARYNAHRTPNCPNFRTLYIRRRSQLLRDTEGTPEKWKQYLRLRGLLLQQRYGSPLEHAASSTPSLLYRSTSRTSESSDNRTGTILSLGGNVVPTRQAEASRAMVGGTTIAENYAFVGVHHIFDQHTKAVTMVKFANNDRLRLCCCSLDGTLSLCSVASNTPEVTAILKGHTASVMTCDWSANNDLISSASLDGTVRVWSVSDAICLRTLTDQNNAEILCCIFQPVNNNLVVTGNNKGAVRIINVSTGRQLKDGECRIGGRVMSLASDTHGKVLWAGNDKGEIISLVCEVGGELHKTRRLQMSQSCCVTSISYRAWISREARDPSLLVNCTANALCLFRVIDREGMLQLKRKFHNKHQNHLVRSSFCPIMSFRQGACVVTGSEDSCVYFLDIEKPSSRACLNTLQGHASVVLGVSFNYDESLLATSDLQGLVIVWRRAYQI